MRRVRRWLVRELSTRCKCCNSRGGRGAWWLCLMCDPAPWWASLPIITGNLDQKQIHRLHDPRTIDRIEHQGKIVDVSTKGRNMRRGGAR